MEPKTDGRAHHMVAGETKMDQCHRADERKGASEEVDGPSTKVPLSMTWNMVVKTEVDRWCHNEGKKALRHQRAEKKRMDWGGFGSRQKQVHTHWSRSWQKHRSSSPTESNALRIGTAT